MITQNEKKLLLAGITAVLYLVGPFEDRSSNALSPPERSVGLTPHDPANPNGMLETLQELNEKVETVAFIQPVKWTFLCSPGPSADSIYSELEWLTAAPASNFKLLYAADFSAGADRKVLNRPVDCSIAAERFSFRNPRVARAWVKEMVWLVRHFRPRFAALGVEVEEYFTARPGEIAPFAAAFEKARSRIKKTDPRIIVFPYFQYENIVLHRSRWKTVKRVLDQVRPDACAFSSYPQSLQALGSFASSAALDAGYYAPLFSHCPRKVPVIFAELGATVSVSSMFDPGSDPALDQASFVANFWRAVQGRNVRLVNWMFFHDLNFLQDCSSACLCTPRSIYDQQTALFFSGMGLKPDKCGPAAHIKNRAALDAFFKKRLSI